jgi:hypothetical protein
VKDGDEDDSENDQAASKVSRNKFNLGSARANLFAETVRKLEEKRKEFCGHFTTASELLQKSSDNPPDGDNVAEVASREIYVAAMDTCKNAVDTWLDIADRVVKKPISKKTTAGSAQPATPISGGVQVEPAKTEEKESPEAKQKPAEAESEAKNLETDGTVTQQPPAQTGNKVSGKAFAEYIESLPAADPLGIFSPEHAGHYTEMNELAKSILMCRTEDAFKEKKIQWVRSMRCVDELAATTVSAATDLKKHVKSAETLRLKNERKAKSEEERKAMDQHRDGLAKMAQSIRDQTNEALMDNGIMCLDLRGKFVAFTVKESKFTNLSDFQHPVVLNDSEAVKVWLLNDKAQKAITSYGSKYKYEKSFKTDFKHTGPIAPDKGKAETEVLFAALLEPAKTEMIDMSSISTSWSTTSWCYGYEVNLNTAGMPPNSSGVFRLLCQGKVITMAMELNNIKEVFEKVAGVGHPFSNSDLVVKHLKGMDQGTLDNLVSLGLKIYYLEHEKDTVYYIPPGYVVIEKGLQGPLIYGVRKSVFLKTPANATNYNLAKGLLNGAGKDVSKMEAVKKLLDGTPVPAPAPAKS